MANDNRTSEQKLAPAGNEGQTSVGQAQNFQQGQDAILAAQRQQDLAAQRAAEAQNRAAQNRPQTDGSSGNEFYGVKFSGLPGTSGSNTAPKRKKG